MARNGNEKAVSDEQIIAAIIGSETFEQAAAKCGISSRTIRERMKEPEFRAEYMAAKDEITRQAVSKLNNQLASAVDTVADIMQNQSNNAAVRLQAAQTIINNAVKLSDRLKDDETKTRRANSTLNEIITDDLFR